VLDIDQIHGFCFDNLITGVVVVVSNEDAIPRDGVEFGDSVLMWLDNPGLATKRAEDGVVGFLAKELLKGTDCATADGGETIGGSAGSSNRFTPPFFGKVGLDHHTERHVDDSFVGALGNSVVLGGVGRRKVVLNSRLLKVVGKSSVAEFTTSISDEPEEIVPGLLFKEGFKVENGLGGGQFLLQEGYTNVAGVLVDQGEKVATSQVGSRGDGPNQVSVNSMERVICPVKVASEREASEFNFHERVTGWRGNELDIRECGFESRNAGVAKAVMPGVKGSGGGGMSGRDKSNS
jgi:hypothetical protein